MRIVTIVGARPQFIKAAPVSRILRERSQHTEVLVHTGQHYDENMSSLFFEELDIPPADHNLGVGSGLHGAQTGKMLARIEQVLLDERRFGRHQPDWVLVYGDTNSTLAAALAAAKLHIRLAHVEAGLRSFNRAMPEEINRVVVDHLSDLLFCPSQTAVDNLTAEGISRGVSLVGDVMAGALASAVESARSRSTILERLGLVERGYLLATVHRAENTDNESRLHGILTALADLGEPVIFPVHPRTRRKLVELGLDNLPSGGGSHNLRLLEPVGYLDMAALEQSARLILTDSGGIQKEAYWLGVPCITLRDETEWVETVQAGWNVLVGADTARIAQAVRSFAPGIGTQSASLATTRPLLYGDGQTAEQIVQVLENSDPVGGDRRPDLSGVGAATQDE